jgi:hypothetical protein
MAGGCQGQRRCPTGTEPVSAGLGWEGDIARQERAGKVLGGCNGRKFVDCWMTDRYIARA